MSKLKKLIPDIKEKLENAQSAEDVLNIIKAEAAEKEFSLENAKATFEKLKLSKEKGQDSKELGEDELENVAGGAPTWWKELECFFGGHDKGLMIAETRKNGYYVRSYKCTNCYNHVWYREYDDGREESCDASAWNE